MTDSTQGYDGNKLDEPNTEFEEFIKRNPPPNIDWSNGPLCKLIGQAMVEEAARSHSIPPVGVKQVETTFRADDGTYLRTKIYQPADLLSDQGRPLIVLIHGGGFCIGVPENEEITARNVVQTHGAIAISIDYRHAPEYKFPYAVEDAWAGLRWAAKNAASYGADPTKGFIVGGSSAGGNLTAVLAHLARDKGLRPPLTGQYLAIPSVGTEEEIPAKYQDRLKSYTKYADSPGLSVAAINSVLKMYQPDLKDGARFCIVNHPKGHAYLPPAYFQIAGADTLRDQGLVYETVLREEYGVPTKLDTYPGLPHGFWSAFPTLSASKAFRRDQVRGFGWLLNSEPRVERLQSLEYDRVVSIQWTTKLWILWVVLKDKLTSLWAL
ncbi:hypothetical protein LTS17_003765 [Exophiala oligosperma]